MKTGTRREGDRNSKKAKNFLAFFFSLGFLRLAFLLRRSSRRRSRELATSQEPVTFPTKALMWRRCGKGCETSVT